MDSITLLDLHWAGKPRCVAAALLESDGHYALVDPGPASTLPALRNHLAEHGLSINTLDAILLTHIHLDHAGATGALVRENPGLPVYVHKVGAPHIVNPTKLLASAGRLWGSDVNRLFGETFPVSPENLRILQGGESLTLGTRKVDVACTPGHASHHVSYFEQSEGIAFVGDTAGVRIENHPYIMPATPPPDVDLAQWDASFTEILSRKPARLFLAHFGFAENPAEHLAIFRERLHAWNANAESILRATPDDTKAQAEFIATARQEIARHVPLEEVDQYAFAAGLDLSFLGLARCIRKRASVSN